MVDAPLILPPKVFASFCGELEEDSVNRIFQSLTMSVHQRVKEFHLLFQCRGGEVGAGFALYNFFQVVPLDLTLYNCGKVGSMGTVAYLGGRKRKASANSSFMIHSVRCGEISGVSADMLRSLAEAMRIDNIRCESTIRKHTDIPDPAWVNFNNHEMNFSAEDAVKVGLANEIAEFSPPLGSQIFSI